MQYVPGDGPEDGEGVGRDVQVGLEHRNSRYVSMYHWPLCMYRVTSQTWPDFSGT